ncbi:MAG: hypothetical protein H7A43_05745 [Verrucomicrobia bacterium]|nr:hypothetical protein [Verrucomicrobiota bacterium]
MKIQLSSLLGLGLLISIQNAPFVQAGNETLEDSTPPEQQEEIAVGPAAGTENSGATVEANEPSRDHELAALDARIARLERDAKELAEKKDQARLFQDMAQSRDQTVNAREAGELYERLHREWVALRSEIQQIRVERDRLLAQREMEPEEIEPSPPAPQHDDLPAGE